MRYVSTRGGMAPKEFTEILLEGLAPDGGLAVPESYPPVAREEFGRLRAAGYPELAFAILSRFATDVPRTELRRLIDRTYTRATFGSDEITPLHTLEPGLHLLETSNGPTLAFKDVAMQLLGNLFEFVLARDRSTLNILGATSGDTGSSAEHALRGKRGIRVFMLSPHGRMSPFQSAQMYSLQDPNIFNIAVRGVFDDCQDIVKTIGADAAFKSRYRIGTVNSINWGRVAAQVVYYFKGYFRATTSDDQAVSFAVPSGNFGNILAGHIARSMGLPVRRLVLATNENDVLDEFFRTGTYRVRTAGETRQTSSPSMDISKASNFERYIHDLVGHDGAVVRDLWRRVERNGRFELAGTREFASIAASGFVSGRSTHADRIATIRSVAARYGRVIDPHTADGLKVAEAYREPGVPMICLETAQPAKFAETIREALGRDPDRPPAYAGLESLPQRYTVLGVDADAVRQFVAERVDAAR